MNDKELINFVEWLPENSGLFEGMTIEETVFKINELSTSDEGKQTLEQLTKRYKGMGFFKKGGTLDLINCLQKGGSIQNCGCGKKIEKAAMGSDGVPKVAKSAMYDSAMELAPEVFGTKKDVRTAYRTAKNLGREQGLSGRDLRNWSRNQVIDKVGAYAGDEPIPHVPLPPDGNVPRSSMFDAAKEFIPSFTRKDVRQAYGVAKGWGRDAGLRGNNLRQYARNQVIDKIYNYADGPDATLINDSPSVNNGASVESAASPRTTNMKRNVFDFVQNNGLSRAQTRLAYQNQKNALRGQGLRGSELRQTALNNMTNSFLPKINNDIEFDDNDIVIDDTFTPLANTPTVQKIDRFGGSFNSAFRSARNSELGKFYYNGPDKKAGWYTTELAANKPTQTGGQIIEGSATAAAPQYVATPVQKSNGNTGYRFGDLLKMAAINNASKM